MSWREFRVLLTGLSAASLTVAALRVTADTTAGPSIAAERPLRVVDTSDQFRVWASRFGTVGAA